MSFSYDQQLEMLSQGQADWDTSLNANFAILERGRQVLAPAGSAINSGQVCVVGSGGVILPMDARSLALRPQAISYRSVTSGETAQFVTHGIVRSMAVWSGGLVPGEPVFVDPRSTGFCVKSFAGHGPAVGLAVGYDAVLFDPGAHGVFPQNQTQVGSCVVARGVSSAYDFSLPVGNRGGVRGVTVVGTHNAFRLRFFSNSTRADSHCVFDSGSTQTTSTHWIDRRMWGWEGADASSAYLLHGRFEAYSGSGQATGTEVITVFAERFR